MRSKVLRVAWTEYLQAVRSKGFIISVVLMPLFLVAALLIPQLLEDEVDLADRRFAVVDRTGRLYHTIASAAEARNREDAYEEGQGGERAQVGPRFLPEEVLEEGERVDVALSDRVRSGELFAFVVIGADVFDREGSDRNVSYHSDSPTFLDLPRWLDDTIETEVRRIRLESAGIDPVLVERLRRGVDFQRLGLASFGEGGEVIEPEPENEAVTYGVPAAAMFFLFMLLMVSAPTLLNAVLEEKMQKISEVLVSAVTPFQLLAGKLASGVLLALSLGSLYVGGVLVVLVHFDVASIVPLSLYLWFVFFLVLALLIFGSIFSALGAACSEMRDAQSLMTPAMLIAMVPMFCWVSVLQAPTSTFSRVISLVPPFTPMLMLLRISVPPGPPWWEVALSVLFTTAFATACVWASAKIFRIGILSQGQAPTLRRLVRWVISG